MLSFTTFNRYFNSTYSVFSIDDANILYFAAGSTCFGNYEYENNVTIYFTSYQ